jgi:hypothetical protein
LKESIFGFDAALDSTAIVHLLLMLYSDSCIDDLLESRGNEEQSKLGAMIHSQVTDENGDHNAHGSQTEHHQIRHAVEVTRQALASVADVPLSIVIVGIGNTDFIDGKS